MNKKGLMVLALAVLTAGGVFAQTTWWNSYAPAVADNKMFVNAVVGFGPTGGWDMGVPPVSASVDFKLPIPAPITLGAMTSFSTWRRTDNLADDKIDATYTNIGLGLQGKYHFNFIEKVDAYAGFTIGYVMQNSEVKYSSEYASGNDGSYEGANFLLYGVSIGAHYFFSDFIGAYLELGYSPLQYLGVGISRKF